MISRCKVRWNGEVKRGFLEGVNQNGFQKGRRFSELVRGLVGIWVFCCFRLIVICLRLDGDIVDVIRILGIGFVLFICILFFLGVRCDSEQAGQLLIVLELSKLRGIVQLFVFVDGLFKGIGCGLLWRILNIVQGFYFFFLRQGFGFVLFRYVFVSVFMEFRSFW